MSTTNKVTVEDIEARIVKTEFHILPDTTTTVCVITLDNGWNETGISACVDPANFNKEEGEKWSRLQAFNKLWVPLGFLLKERLWHASKDSFLDRLRAERDDLLVRMEKLSAFIGSEAFDQLDPEASSDLLVQKDAMNNLAFILSKRYDDLAAK